MRSLQNTALVVVDMQNDFMDSGALPIPGAKALISIINRLMESGLFAHIIATRDWHPKNHCSFKTQGGRWPPHCVQDTPGAQFPAELHAHLIQKSFLKGDKPDRDAYSAFYDDRGHENSELLNYLHKQQIHDLYFVGVATDVCIRANALHALQKGFKVHVIRDAVAGISPQESQEALKEVQKAGGELLSSSTLLN